LAFKQLIANSSPSFPLLGHRKDPYFEKSELPRRIPALQLRLFITGFLIGLLGYGETLRKMRSARKEDVTLDLEMVFRVIFVVGIVAIPLLYWLSGRTTERNQSPARNEEEWAKQGEERNLSRSS
jgi:hypothetical protein